MTILKVTQTTQLVTGIAQNVFWLSVVQALDATDVTNVRNDVGAWLKTMYETLNGQQVDDISFGDFRIDTVDPLTNFETFYLDGNAAILAPGGTGDPLPQGNAPMIEGLVTGTAYKARKFIPGWKEDAVLGDNITTAGVTALAAFLVEWIVAPNNLNHTYESGLWSRTDKAFYPLVSGTVSTVMSYQRRRKPGVGV